MRSFWNGSIGFGLVNIPVAAHTSKKPRRRDFEFHQHWAKDMSRIKRPAVAESTGEEVAPDEIVKACETPEGQVTLTSEEEQSLKTDAAPQFTINEFVPAGHIAPVFYNHAYYLSPLRGGEQAFVLLREALRKSDQAGVGIVVMRRCEEFALVRPYEHILVLGVMHFLENLEDPAEIQFCEPKIEPTQKDMATMLIEQMSGQWEPTKYIDPYRKRARELIESKIAQAPAPPALKVSKPTKPVDITAILRASLNQVAKKKKAH